VSGADRFEVEVELVVPQVKARRRGGSNTRILPEKGSRNGSPEKLIVPPARASSSTLDGNQWASPSGVATASQVRSTERA
jgi:hypothetical protein